MKTNMDVRRTVAARAFLALGILFLTFQGSGVIKAATARTQNFTVTAATPELAEEFAQRAEELRVELAELWLGAPMGAWWRPAVVRITVGENLGGGGDTTFQFDSQRHEVYGWDMSIQGTRERILDSVLPHEITHMILASDFRRPVPRWADEGMAVASEYEGERQRHRDMLIEALQSDRGIAFEQMMTMTDYPPEPYLFPFYAQGFSLTDYLLRVGGRPKFVAFVKEATQTGDWNAGVQSHYGFQNVRQLQETWNAWVAQGFPNLRDSEPVAPPTPESLGQPDPVRWATTEIPAGNERTIPSGDPAVYSAPLPLDRNAAHADYLATYDQRRVQPNPTPAPMGNPLDMERVSAMSQPPTQPTYPEMSGRPMSLPERPATSERFAPTAVSEREILLHWTR
jgi:hypothetical protein